MRKLMVMMLGLTLLTGAVSVAFGSQAIERKDKKKKKKKTAAPSFVGQFRG